MARNLIPSDATIKAIKQGHPRKRLSDGDGLLLLLFVKGGSHGWRFDYRIEGKRKMLSLGTYPDTSLAAARRKAEAARELVAESFDPSKKLQPEKAANVQARAVEVRREQGLPPLDSFEATAREWFAVKRGGWAPGYADKIIARLEADVFPWIGQAPVAGVTRCSYWKSCGASSLVASSKPRTGRWRTAVRSFATRWPRGSTRPTPLAI
jgi:Arm DNA-binding domain